MSAAGTQHWARRRVRRSSLRLNVTYVSRIAALFSLCQIWDLRHSEAIPERNSSAVKIDRHWRRSRRESRDKCLWKRRSRNSEGKGEIQPKIREGREKQRIGKEEKDSQTKINIDIWTRVSYAIARNPWVFFTGWTWRECNAYLGSGYKVRGSSDYSMFLCNIN